MILRTVLLGTAILSLAALAAGAQAAEIRPPVSAPAAAAEKSAPAETFDRYQVLISNNIFIRDRAAAKKRGEEGGPGPVAPAAGAEESTVLRGIVRDLESPGAPYVACLEDLRTNTITKVRIGSLVCQGALSNPTLDSVDYVKNGVAKRIEIGKSLAGEAAPANVPYQDPAAAAHAVPPKAPGGSPAKADEKPDAPAPASAEVDANSASTTPSEQNSLDAVMEQLRQKRIKDLTSRNPAEWSGSSSAGTASSSASTALPASPASITEQLRLKRIKDLGQ